MVPRGYHTAFGLASILFLGQRHVRPPRENSLPADLGHYGDLAGLPIRGVLVDEVFEIFCPPYHHLASHVPHGVDWVRVLGIDIYCSTPPIRLRTTTLVSTRSWYSTVDSYTKGFV